MNFDFKRFANHYWPSINRRIFDYVSRSVLAGLSYQASLVVDSVVLKVVSFLLLILLAVGIWVDVYIVAEWFSDKARGLNKRAFKFFFYPFYIISISLVFYFLNEALKDFLGFYFASEFQSS